MIDLEKLARLQFIDGLLGYLELRHWAFAKIAAITPPADLADMQRNHYLYFSSLFGVVDLVKDYLGPPDNAAFEQQARDGFAHPGDYVYARTLRNVIVHAGVNPAMAGTVEDGFVRTLCPTTVCDGRRKTPRICSCSLRTMVELAEAADTAVNSAVFAVLGQEQLLDPASGVMGIDQALDAVEASQHMPDWAKGMAAGQFAKMDFEAMSRDLAQSRVDRLRTLLGQT
jgi:hypothetical protein